MLLLIASALGAAQFAGRFAYSMSASIDMYAFGWPLPYAFAVDRYGEDRGHFIHLPAWSLHPRWFWSGSRLCIDALISVMLLAGTAWAAEIHLRRWPDVQFGLPQLLWWTALTGAVLSIHVAEPEWVQSTAARLGDDPYQRPMPWVKLSWYIRLPVLFSLGCALDALAQCSRATFNGMAAMQVFPLARAHRGD